MCAARLKIVARNARPVTLDEPERSAVSVYDLDLNDEHMAQVYRFRGPGKFDREKWKGWRAYCAWRQNNKRLMDERDAMMTEEELEQQRIAADDPHCWMCGGDGECERYNEEAGYEESFTCPECEGTGVGS
jgi:hypothetical protein